MSEEESLEKEIQEASYKGAKQALEEFPRTPQIQEVRVSNFPKQEKPVVNVTVPEVKVPPIKIPEIKIPEVKVPATDLSELSKGLTDLAGKLDKLIEKDVPEFDYDEFEKKLKTIKLIGGGHGGGSNKRHVLDIDGNPVDPMGRDKQIDISDIAALDDGENYATAWIDRKGFTGIKVAFTTDQNGYYTITYSPDGVNTDSTLTRYYRTGEINPPHKFENMRRYVKVTIYNDSGSNQTYLRGDISLTNSAGILNIPTDATMAKSYDSISTRPTDFKYEVALGRRQGYSLFNKFGYNTDVDTASDPEVVAAFGGTSFTPLTTASTLTIVSASTDDDGDPGGTGARTILITGIDANRNLQTENVTLNGQTNVVTTTTWLGINRAVVISSGTNDANVGDITITATTGGSNQALIPAGQSVTQQLIFFNYADHIALIEFIELNALRFGSGTEPTVTFKGWAYSPVVDTKFELFRESVNTNVAVNVQLDLSLPFPLNSGDVFWIEAETTRDDTSVSGRFSLVTVKDVDA